MVRIERLHGSSILLFASLLITACGGEPEPVEERLRPVRYVTVESSDGFRDRSFSGTSKSSTESRLSFKVSGSVINVPVQNGQRLDAGDLIAEIDPATYELQTQQAQASLVEAEANNRRATANYDRTKGLYADDNASLNDLESARAEAESAEAVVASASKALEIARLNRSYTRLTADTDCDIADSGPSTSIINIAPAFWGRSADECSLTISIAWPSINSRAQGITGCAMMRETASAAEAISA